MTDRLLPRWTDPITAPAAALYGAVIHRRNDRYDRGRAVARAPIPVISVGNLSVGGTGKSPTTGWIAERLLAAGHRPMIVLRGYGAKAGRPSDEAYEHVARHEDLVVAVGADRRTAIDEARGEHPSTDVAVLDDGFQHRRIHRDLDLVLVDGSQPLTDARLLPWGRLREPVASLARADAVVVTRADRLLEDRATLASTIERAHGRPAVAWARHHWAGLKVVDAEGPRSEPVAWLAGRSVTTMLGVAGPAGVRAQAEAAGATIVRDLPRRDHHDYRPADLVAMDRALTRTDGLLVTTKDWVKLARLLDLTTLAGPVIVPELVLEITEGGDELERLVLAAATDRR